MFQQSSITPSNSTLWGELGVSRGAQQPPQNLSSHITLSPASTYLGM